MNQGMEEWEKKIKERQPPEKVMDAIAVQPGMVIGEVGAGKDDDIGVQINADGR